MNPASSAARRSPAAAPTTRKPARALSTAAAATHSFSPIATFSPRHRRCSIRPHYLTALVQNQPQPLQRGPSQTRFAIPTYLRQGPRGLAASRMSSSDDAYTAFLERANDTSAPAGTSSAGHTSRQGGFTTSSVDTPVPTALSSVDAYYTSESDEPFEAVSLKLEQHVESISADIITKLTGYEDVETMSITSFDPRGEYGAVIEAVKKAGEGEVQVFRIELGGARCEYWILGLDRKNSRVVGMRASAVES